MSHNEALAFRISQILADKNIEAEEKKMFGGVAFMVNEKMSVGVTNKGDLMVRCLPEKMDWALEQTGCRQMDFTGKPMKGFLFLDESAYPTEKALADWIGLGLEVAFAPVQKKKK
jgi:TfoX/Sxy family transcriptional regulator of competence genes